MISTLESKGRFLEVHFLDDFGLLIPRSQNLRTFVQNNGFFWNDKFLLEFIFALLISAKRPSMKRPPDSHLNSAITAVSSTTADM